MKSHAPPARVPKAGPLPYAVLIGGMLLLLYFLGRPAQYSGWPPSSASEPVRLHLLALALAPGDTFKGRSVTLLRMDTEEPNNWDVHFFPYLVLKYRASLNNDMTNDARALGVPVANEFGHWISPPMLALFAAAFYKPKDQVGRATQAPRAYRANLARLMGVAMVVSDSPIPGEARIYEGTAGGHPLYLHTVGNANLGQYSPTRILIAGDARAILDHLQDPEFDGEKLAVLETPLEGSLVRAERVSVRLDKGPTLLVTAHSSGRSLLVLPFDYSDCLRIRGTGLERKLPVNLSQTGIVIQGDASVEISYRYGLSGGVSCRKKDLQRARALGLENAATGRLFHDARR